MVIVRRDNKESLLVKVVSPSQETINVLLETAAGKVYMYIVNLNGAVVLKKELYLIAGSSL